MKSYVWVTFAFMGWSYYEMSGGAEFEPQAPAIAAVEEVEAPEIVARAPQQTLLSVSTSNVTPQAEVYTPQPTDIVAAAPEPVEPVAEPVVVPVAAPVTDIRYVSGTRVNMRMGPGTNFEVIVTLNGGTELEILDVDSEGWANVSVVDTGLEGWMAERLLTEPQT